MFLGIGDLPDCVAELSASLFGHLHHDVGEGLAGRAEGDHLLLVSSGRLDELLVVGLRFLEPGDDPEGREDLVIFGVVFLGTRRSRLHLVFLTREGKEVEQMD